VVGGARAGRLTLRLQPASGLTVAQCSASLTIAPPAPLVLELARIATRLDLTTTTAATIVLQAAAIGPQGPAGPPGADGNQLQPTYRLRPVGGWSEAGDTYVDALPSEPLEPTEVVLVHSGVGARFHVDPPEADPVGIEFQLSGPQNRTIRFGDIRPREGDQIHVEPYLRTP
jgi:hypothetical protein